MVKIPMSDDDPLKGILAEVRKATDIEIGPGQPISLSTSELDEMQRDAEILALARAGLTYIEIGKRLEMPLNVVVGRIAGMLKGEPLLSEEHIAGYLAHQLDLLSVGIENSLSDMEAPDGWEEWEAKLAATRRHNGRMALHKFVVHQAMILGLLRQRIDINRREQVNITVVRAEDYDAL